MFDGKKLNREKVVDRVSLSQVNEALNALEPLRLQKMYEVLSYMHEASYTGQDLSHEFAESVIRDALLTSLSGAQDNLKITNWVGFGFTDISVKMKCGTGM